MNKGSEKKRDRDEKACKWKMLILYEVMNFGLTYFHMIGNIILKTGNLSVCQAAK